MNILIFNWRCWLHPWAGGAERYLYEISKRLVRKGNNVTWFVSHAKGLKEKEIIDGIEIIRKGGKYSVYFYALEYYLKELRKRNFDIVIDDINGVPFFTPLFVRKPKVAVIHHLVKDIFFKELPFPLALIGWIAERLIPLIYFKVDFITVSNTSKRELEDFGIKNIKIIPNGIDTNLFKPSLKTSCPTILFLGRLKRYKRLDILLKTFNIVSQRIPEAKLWIAGKGETKKELEDLAKRLKIQNKIKFFGHVGENEKIKLLQKAWVFVTPSEKEGWGITVMEANACGTPCIAYDVPGLRDSIINGKTGILVKEDGNIKALAEAIIKILLDEELREELSRNAIEWAKQFSWDRSAEEFEKLIKSLFS